MSIYKDISRIIKSELTGIDRVTFFSISSVVIFLSTLIIFNITDYGTNPSGGKRLVGLAFCPVLNFLLIVRMKQSSTPPIIRVIVLIFFSGFLALL